jgi:hypothetical protein
MFAAVRYTARRLFKILTYIKRLMMKKTVTCVLLSVLSSVVLAGGHPISVEELAGKWKIIKLTGPGGREMPLGDSAYYVFTNNGDFIEEIDGSKMKRRFFIEDSKLMIKGPIAGLNFEWDVIAKGSGNLTLKTSNQEVIELKK